MEAKVTVARGSGGKYSYAVWVGNDLAQAGTGISGLKTVLARVEKIAGALPGEIVRMELALVSE